jgi:hypothetical protein
MIKSKRIKERVKRLWFKACEYDGIDPRAMFVVHSDDNPYRKKYYRAVRKLQETIQERGEDNERNQGTNYGRG